MDIKISGTDNTRALINNVIRGMRKIKPNQRQVDYTVSLCDKKHIYELTTWEQDGVMRNVSILHLHNLSPFRGDIRAAIWNKSGKIAIHDMPARMPTKKAFKTIKKFLKQLQFENILKPNEIRCKTSHSQNSNILRINAKFDKFSLHKKIEGFNSRWFFEIFEDYKHE